MNKLGIKYKKPNNRCIRLSVYKSPPPNMSEDWGKRWKNKPVLNKSWQTENQVNQFLVNYEKAGQFIIHISNLSLFVRRYFIFQQKWIFMKVCEFEIESSRTKISVAILFIFYKWQYCGRRWKNIASGFTNFLIMRRAERTSGLVANICGVNHHSSSH